MIPCEANPEFWFSESPQDVAEAKAACGYCPVKENCADMGEDEEFGVWGGKSPEDRRDSKRLRLLIREEWTSSEIKRMTTEGNSISYMARELGIPRKTLADRLRRASGLAA